MARNIRLPEGFGDRLVRLREERHLSRADLAELAGATYRTIYNIERTRHEKALERTLMQIAKALEMSYADLLEMPQEAVEAPSASPPARSPRDRLRRAAMIAAAGLVFFSLIGGFVWRQATRNAIFEVVDHTLVVRDSVFRSNLWSLRESALVSLVTVAPWDSGILLAGLSSRTPNGGRVLALERASGRLVWECTPDLDQLGRAMDDSLLAAAGMSCNLIRALDVDGDGEPEVLARFIHGLYHPTALCLIGRDGTLLKQYAHKGHLIDVLVTDLDGDGKDEVLAGGVNNARELNGPTVLMLDDEHWRGASVDALTNPWSAEPDSCLYRMALPAFPARYRATMGDFRLAAGRLKTVRQPDGRLFVSFCARGNREPLQAIWVLCDDRLRVVRAIAEDSFVQAITYSWPDSLRNAPNPTDPEWCAKWLSGARYGGAGS